jgi:preprotein translocase subunit SecA
MNLPGPNHPWCRPREGVPEVLDHLQHFLRRRYRELINIMVFRASAASFLLKRDRYLYNTPFTRPNMAIYKTNNRLLDNKDIKGTASKVLLDNLTAYKPIIAPQTDTGLYREVCNPHSISKVVL